MNNYVVYKHTNKINGKIYIGITKHGDNPNKRWRNGMGYVENRLFFPEIIKYGWDNFFHDILEYNLTESEAIQREKYYIKLYQSADGNNYNLASSSGVLTKEGIESISRALTGIKRNPASIKKQMDTKKERYGSGRGVNYNGSQAKKVRCNETGDIFATIAEACRWCGSSKVSQCCKGERKHAGTHPITGEQLTWSYVEDNSIITIRCEEEIREKKVIQQIQCIETGKIYKNATEASKDTGIAICNILRVCRGQRKSAGQMHWKFL